MEFYYCPVMGLKYFFVDPMIVLDITALPKNTITLEEALSLMNNMGIVLKNSLEQDPVEIIPQILTNA